MLKMYTINCNKLTNVKYLKEKSWDDYTIKFNLLSDKMSEAGININMLTDLINSYESLSREHSNIK